MTKRKQVLRYARPRRPSDGKELTIDDVRKWQKTTEAEIARASAFIRATIKHKPEYAYLEETVSFMEETEITLRQAEAVLMTTEVLLRGTLDGRLDFAEMLRMINAPNVGSKKKSRQLLDAMRDGTLPFHRDQVQ
jgi:hypothetical protein